MNKKVRAGRVKVRAKEGNNNNLNPYECEI